MHPDTALCPDIWYHGSPHNLLVLAAGSTITTWKELAEAFAHKPTLLEYDTVHGAIRHNGTTPGFLYVLGEDIDIRKDIQPHPDSTMDAHVEWLTTRPLRLLRISTLP